MTKSHTNIPILDDDAVAEIESDLAESSPSMGGVAGLFRQHCESLCQTVRALRAENERLKASDTFWQAEALLEHFCSEHAKNTRQAGYYCTICAKPFVMSVPQGTRPVKYTDLQSQLEQLTKERDNARTENERLTSQLKEWQEDKDAKAGYV